MWDVRFCDSVAKSVVWLTGEDVSAKPEAQSHGFVVGNQRGNQFDRERCRRRTAFAAQGRELGLVSSGQPCNLSLGVGEACELSKVLADGLATVVWSRRSLRTFLRK